MNQQKTNEFFIPGKLSVILDGGAGSSGKGKIGSYVVKHATNVQFVCNTFMPQASHTIVEDGKTYVYKQLNSCAHNHTKFEKMYIGHGSVIDVAALLKEIEMTGLPKEKLGIDPLATVLQGIDTDFEKGESDFDGDVSRSTTGAVKKHDGTIKYGSTCSGVGAARARKILRRPNIKVARDIPELQPYLCNVSEEIMQRLDKGQSGLLEIAQGFQLSYGLAQFYPHCTSRNCTVAAGFDDMMLPVNYIGNVLLNFRTFPIRIHSYKYIGKDGKHLTWDEVQSGNVPHDKIDSHSGEFYPDQTELTWEQVTTNADAPKLIMETTTLTKLPRRVATFSRTNLEESIRYNQTPHKVFISLNFVNYVSWDMYRITDSIDVKVRTFIDENIMPSMGKFKNVSLKYLGTSEETDDTIVLN